MYYRLASSSMHCISALASVTSTRIVANVLFQDELGMRAGFPRRSWNRIQPINAGASTRLSVNNSILAGCWIALRSSATMASTYDSMPMQPHESGQSMRSRSSWSTCDSCFYCASTRGSLDTPTTHNTTCTPPQTKYPTRQPIVSSSTPPSTRPTP